MHTWDLSCFRIHCLIHFSYLLFPAVHVWTRWRYSGPEGFQEDRTHQKETEPMLSLSAKIQNIRDRLKSGTQNVSRRDVPLPAANFWARWRHSGPEGSQENQDAPERKWTNYIAARQDAKQQSRAEVRNRGAISGQQRTVRECFLWSFCGL
jgi:hypothetical protein